MHVFDADQEKWSAFLCPSYVPHDTGQLFLRSLQHGSVLKTVYWFTRPLQPFLQFGKKNRWAIERNPLEQIYVFEQAKTIRTQYGCDAVLKCIHMEDLIATKTTIDCFIFSSKQMHYCGQLLLSAILIRRPFKTNIHLFLISGIAKFLLVLKCLRSSWISSFQSKFARKI